MSVKAIIEELKSSDEFARREACRMLGEMGAKEALTSLVGAFSDDSWLVREAAVEALIKIGDERGLSLLFSVLKDKDARVRSAAVEILTGLGEIAIDLVIEALRDENENTVRYAADVLGDVGDKKAVGHLITALENPSIDVQYYVIQSLGKLRDKTATESLLTFLDNEEMWLQSCAVEALGIIGDIRASKRLTELFLTDTFIKGQVAEALGKLADTSTIIDLLKAMDKENNELNKAILTATVSITERHGEGDVKFDKSLNIEVIEEACLKALDEEESFLKKSGARVLGWLKSEKAVVPLANMLGDSFEDVGSVARSALSSIGRAALPVLIEQLSANEKMTRIFAIEAINEVATRKDLAPLLSRLKDETDDEARRAIVSVIGKKTPDNGIEILLGLLNDESDLVRKAAVISLAAYPKNESIFEKLDEALSTGTSQEKKSAAEYFGGTKETRAAKDLELLLKDEDPGVKQAGVFALAKVQDINVGSLPIMLLGSEDPVLRKSAAIVLGDLKDKRGVEPLCITLNDNDIWVRYYSALALGAIGDERSAVRLIDGLQDEIGGVRLACVRSLVSIGGTAGEKALIELVTDQDEDVRKTLAEALHTFSSQKSHDTLRRLLSDNSWKVREAAAKSAGEIKGFEKDIEVLLTDTNRFVKEAAKTALGAN
ncbi:MAG: HEAT repeat domain-containing protein [Deltaproteobacteria bacterium]|nr:HEAT repeat domain-containing protein [Deltaproteobacteria bacterium]